MKTILVTGSNGQLGKSIEEWVKKNTPSELNFIFTNKQNLDITNPQKINHFFNQKAIDVVINCAAYTAVDAAETDEKNAFRINRDAVEYIAEVCAKHKAKLIHISTDYVFNGNFNQPIKPKENANPINVYGKSKYAGEVNALAKNSETLIIRTAWVYSKFGRNFVKTMLKLFSEREEIKIVNDQYGTPTNASDLATAILEIITGNLFKPGIYHYTNKGETTWFEFANAIKKITNSPIAIHPIPSSEFNSKAQRPRYSVLSLKEFEQTFKQNIPYWEDSLKNALLQDFYL